MLYEDEDETGQRPAEAPSAPPPVSSASIEQNSQQPASPPPPLFHPLAYRGVVANWPVEWREQWGRRANFLEESGLSWRDAETQAFVEVWNQVRNHTPQQSGESMPAPNAERN